MVGEHGNYINVSKAMRKAEREGAKKNKRGYQG
jgi:hypothetical protein